MSGFIQHEMLPSTTHDEQARQEFVGALRGHLSGRLMPGAYRVYHEKVEPSFKARHGRSPATEQEVRALMTQEPFYQFWSAMLRRSQEMMWESVIDPTERQLPELVERSRRLSRRALAGRRKGTLRLDPSLEVPRYHSAADIHLQPGGYHTDFTTDDVAAGAVYDKGINIYMGGALGSENDLMGNTLLAFVRERHPQFRPGAILDMGCAIGNSSVVWARAFPQARVHGIDVGAPVLRYAHARAASLGKAVHFAQQDAEATRFPDAHFDLIVSHIMVHETSHAAIRRILRECHRLLAPGGVMLHVETPPFRALDPYDQFMLDWDTHNNNEPYWTGSHELDPVQLAAECGFDPATVFEAMQPSAFHAAEAQRTHVFQCGDFGGGGAWYLWGARK